MYLGSQPTRTCSKKVKMLQARSHGFDQLLVGWGNTLKRNLVKTHHFTNKKLYKTKIKLFVFWIVVSSLLWMLSKIKKRFSVLFLFLQKGNVTGFNTSICFLQVFEEVGIAPNIKRICGASAGSIAGALLAVDYDSKKLYELLSIDMQKILIGKFLWSESLPCNIT